MISYNDKKIQELFEETTIWKNGTEIRRYYKGKKWARLLWDLIHPDQLCEGFDIHHISQLLHAEACSLFKEDY